MEVPLVNLLDELIELQEATVREQEANTRKHQSLLAQLRESRKQLADSVRAAVPVAESEESKTQFQRIVEFFRARGNQPHTTKAIMAALNISRNALYQIIYRTHRADFQHEPVPGSGSKQQWCLSKKVPLERTLFDGPCAYEVPAPLPPENDDFKDMAALECCEQLLQENNNHPMNALTLARLALRRGYKGGSIEGSEDDVLMTTAKSFWARLGGKDRDKNEKFYQVRPQVYALREFKSGPP